MSDNKSITLYKRNAQGKPIFWKSEILGHKIVLTFGIVGKPGTTTEYVPPRGVGKEWNTIVNAKRREGGMELSELYDNTQPALITDLKAYLSTYLPKYNTNSDGFTLPMLAKIYEFDDFENRIGQIKINGVRCNISAKMDGDGLFQTKRLVFRSRKGLEYKCATLEQYLLSSVISDKLYVRMVDENLVLDGELYVPGRDVNETLSAAENPRNPLNQMLQFWCYDLAIEDMPQINRLTMLRKEFDKFHMPDYVSSKAMLDFHLNNKNRFVLIHNYENFTSDDDVLKYRDIFVDAKFEGIMLRDKFAPYQFGRRNSAMYKCKPILDGKFIIEDIVPEGAKRPNFSKFILRNDINNETFECMPVGDANLREWYLLNRSSLIGRLALVEYRGRSGVANVPYHGNLIKVYEPDGLLDTNE